MLHMGEVHGHNYAMNAGIEYVVHPESTSVLIFI